MKEREQTEAPYWQRRLALGEALLHGEKTPLYMKLHTSKERYSALDREELVPLSTPTGERLYVHGKPYLRSPDIRLTVVLRHQTIERGEIGQVVSAQQQGFREREIGQAQAWYYPADKLLVLWECYLFDSYQQTKDPREDAMLTTVWTGFEQVLANHLPATSRIVTPAWEDIYDREQWQAFLGLRGYTLIGPQVMQKELA
jgi:hypothetical protein